MSGQVVSCDCVADEHLPIEAIRGIFVRTKRSSTKSPPHLLIRAESWNCVVAK